MARVDLEDGKAATRAMYIAGIKAGLGAELVSITFFWGFLLVNLYSSGLAHPSVWRVFILIAESEIPYSIIVGSIIGIVFAATHDRFLKGTALELKGTLYGIGYWLLVILPNVLRLPTGQFFFSPGAIVLSLTGYLILGLVLGNLYRRFSSKQLVHQTA